jgi:hypothetical protein
MRKTSLTVALLSFVVIGVTLLWNGTAAGERAGGPAGGTPFAGTFLLVFEVPGLPPLLAVSQSHADGTGITFDQTDEGLGGATPLNSLAAYSWRRTGPHQATFTGLAFSFDAAGLPTVVSRDTVVSNFDPSFDFGAGTVFERNYDVAAGEDPLDPTQGTPGGEIPFTFRRLIPG